MIRLRIDRKIDLSQFRDEGHLMFEIDKLKTIFFASIIERAIDDMEIRHSDSISAGVRDVAILFDYISAKEFWVINKFLEENLSDEKKAELKELTKQFYYK